MPVLNYVQLLKHLSTDPAAVGILIALVAGLNLVLCFFGQRLFRILTAVYACGLVSLILIAVAHPFVPHWGYTLLAVIPGVLLGILLKRWLVYFVLFVMGAYVAVFAVGFVYGWKGLGIPPVWLAVLAMAAGGIPAVFLHKPFIILFTALPSSVNVMQGVFYFAGLPGLKPAQHVGNFFQKTYATMFTPLRLEQIVAVVLLVVVSLFIQDRWTASTVLSEKKPAPPDGYPQRPL